MMSGSTPSGGDSLPLTMAREIDRTADRFEAEWKAGRQPRIENYLLKVQEPIQSRLLCELLRVELDCRRLRGEKPTAANYHSRFPEHRALIEKVLQGGLPKFLPVPAGCREQPEAPRDIGAPPPSPTGLHVSRGDSDGESSSENSSAPPKIPGYEILGDLGKGGMGIVYKARQVELDRIVALKMIQTHRLRDGASRIRFRSEARAVAKFDHPNIVRVYDSGEHDGRPYYALELVQGGNLEQQRQRGHWSPREAVQLVAQLADAVEYAHRQGIVHRDLKPENILLTVDGTPKITDFGLSKQLQDDLGNQTCPGEPIGTPAYMAPEAADGRLESIGPSTDIFGLGGILYFLLTGRPLFQGKRLALVLKQARQGQVSPLRQFNRRIPAALERICLKALAPDPQKRYASAAALSEDLRRFLRRRWRVLWAATAMAGLLLVGLTACLLTGGPGQFGKKAVAPSTAIPVSPGASASRAKEILQTYCYRCHGQDGNNEGGFNYLLDSRQLVARKKIVPGQPEQSRLYQRLTDADNGMPPAEEMPRPGAAEIAELRQWIADGAPEFNPSAESARSFISPADELRFIFDDLVKAEPRNQQFLRYFTITHFYNAGLSEDELQTYRHGLAKLINSLSWGHRVEVPEPIDKAKTIFRIDLRHYQWDAEVWKAILAKYPYRVVQTTPTAMAIYAATVCELPYVRADWFVFEASKPPLYHEVLQLPKTDRELEKKLHVDVDNNIQKDQVARAGFNGSGVSQNNRLIERHESSYGAYWKSYDFARNDGQKNLFAHPLGPRGGDNRFEHDGGEIIFNLPNGLQAYLLVDSKGNRIDKGPANIVSDPKQPDRTVVNGISCMSCHAKGMIDKADQVRAHVVENRNAFAKEDAEKILALYPLRGKFLAKLKEDADRFRVAVEKTGAQLSATEPVVALALRYNWELDLKQAAAETGDKAEDFRRKLEQSVLAPTIGPLLIAGGTIQRQVYEADFRILVSPEPPPPVRIPPPPPGDVIVNSIGMRLRRIPSGQFLMGSPPKEEGRNEDEIPHVEKINQPFAIGVYEVTQAQYQKVMSKNPSHFRGGIDTDTFPVDGVSYGDAVAFCTKLTNLDAEKNARRVYRLPTEAEWEYACRAGSQKKFGFGDDDKELVEHAWIATNSGKMTHPVGQKKPNAWGLYDMHGNVEEWCQAPNGQGNGLFQPVLRGGSWEDDRLACRAAARHPSIDIPNKAFGFRVVLILDHRAD